MIEPIVNLVPTHVQYSHARHSKKGRTGNPPVSAIFQSFAIEVMTAPLNQLISNDC